MAEKGAARLAIGESTQNRSGEQERRVAIIFSGRGGDSRMQAA
jgi:hypothetical protein